MPNTCVVCGHIKSKGSNVSMHRFPANPAKRQQWLKALGLEEGDLSEHTRICSRHFLNGDASQVPSPELGKRFASPKKLLTERGKRAAKWAESSPNQLPLKRRALKQASHVSSDSSSQAVSPMEGFSDPHLALVGEPLLSDYNVHELPGHEERTSSDVVVNAAFIARIEVLEAENFKLKQQLESARPKYFRLEDIAHDDALVRFYTGFASYEVLLIFFEFLGPSVNRLHYWGKEAAPKRACKLNPLNQFFLTLVRLRLNAQVKDLAHRFGISAGLVSRYVITWICFLYQYLQEIEWMPTPEQVASNLPHVFKEKYPTTFGIIDGTEIFIETPSDLHLQSSTWSSYKHHNTAKVLVCVTPNGVISYVSPVYVGSISDIELTKLSGFLQKIPTSSPGISIMADRGFTIQDELNKIGIKLNIPSFLGGRKQLTPSEVESSRKIASVRVHVERAIGRIKQFGILRSTLPITMARLINQIVSVCAWLTSFQPALVPAPTGDDMVESEVEDYFDTVYESDYDADSELSEDEC